MVRRLAEDTQGARWLTDQVQREWKTIPQSAHNTIRQSVVRELLRSCKTAVLKTTSIPEAAGPLRELMSTGIALGREMRAQVEATDWTDFPPPLPMGLELGRAIEALTNLTALFVLRRGKEGLLEKAGGILGAPFALGEVADFFGASLYIGYTSDFEAQDEE